MSASLPPAASATATRLSNTRRVCRVMSPSTRLPVAGSSGIWPEKYTVLPARTACEYGPMADGAFSVAMVLRVMGDVLDGSSQSIGAAWASPAASERVAVNPADNAGAPDPTHDVGEVLAILHLDGEQQGGCRAVALDVLDVLDVRPGIGDRRRDRREHARAIEHFDAQLGAVVAFDIAVPLDGHDALGRLAELDHVRAFHPVHDDALARGQETDDLVTRQGMAAVAKAEDTALGTADADLLGGVFGRRLRM